MTMTELFLAELEREAPLTRRTLERVPDGHYHFTPTEKSMPFGYLAELVARLPSWIAMTINQDSLDLNPAGGRPKHPELRTSQALVQTLDESVAAGRAALKGTNDAHLMTHWKLMAGGHVVSDQPRHQVLRDGVMNHLAHHRGQLTVYLRLLGATVPSIYGPSADERTF
jgi:uncharacterized damage-inducible protein DinB